MISKILFLVALLALVAVLACGGDDESEAPADTAVPQPTAVSVASPTSTPRPAPTADPEPTAVPELTEAPAAATPAPTEAPTPEPTAATEAPEQIPGSSVIAPLLLDDPIGIATELSEGELACSAGVAPLDRLLQIFGAPDTATPEEQSQLIGCLEDETVLRVFLTGLIGMSDPLSEESSQCIRTGLAGVDVRSVMLAGTAGDAEAAMVGSMSAFFLTLSCLNEDEWQAAAPSLGMGPADREGLQCLLEELGGPEGFSETLGSGEEGSIFALFGAAIGCGLEMEGGPGIIDGRTDIPQPTPGTEQGTGAGEMTEMQMEGFSSIIAGLSDMELTCLAGSGVSPESMQDPSGLDFATPEQQTQIFGCFDDKTVLNLFLSGLVGDPSQLSEETSTCIQTGMEGIDLRGVILAGTGGDEEAAMVGSMSAMMLTVSCLDEEEWQATAPALGMQPGERENLQCVMDQLGGPEGMGEALGSEDGSGIMAFFGAAITCGLQMEDMSPGS